MASPNLSRASGSTSAAPGSGSTPSLSEHTETETRPTDIKAPLWNHVTILEKAKPGGGNVLWKCNYVAVMCDQCIALLYVEFMS